MEIRVLGPVELWNEGQQVSLGSIKERCVLAVLLLEHGRLVPASRLIDLVWGDDPPAKVRDSLYSHVAHLRRALASTDEREASSIRQHSGGYELHIPPDTWDLQRFRDTVRDADDSRANGDEASAARLLRAADALWHGEALSGITGDWAERARYLLHRERERAVSARIDDELRLGRCTDLVGELTDRVEQDPVDEHRVAQLMLALQGCGRHQAALDCYRRLRARLIEEIGDEPGQELQRLHERILQRDPELVHDEVDLRSSPSRGTESSAPGLHFGGPVVVHGDIVRGNKIIAAEPSPHPR